MRPLVPALLALLSLGSGSGAAAAVGAPVEVPAVQFYEGSFECYEGTLALRLPDTYPQLLRIGHLRSVRNLRSQSAHGFTSTERQLEFPGLILHVYVFSGDPDRYQLGSVQIRSSGWTLSPLQVGAASNAVSLPRDWPALPRTGHWQVQGDSAHLIVQVTAGRITAIDYDCDSAS